MKADVYYTYFAQRLPIVFAVSCNLSCLFAQFLFLLYFISTMKIWKMTSLARKKGIHVFNNIINHCNCFNDFNSLLSRSSLMVHFQMINSAILSRLIFLFEIRIRQSFESFEIGEICLLNSNIAKTNKTLPKIKISEDKFKHQSCFPIDWHLLTAAVRHHML